MMLGLLPTIAVSLLLVGSAVGDPVLVSTEYGPVEGHTVDLDDGSHVNSFLGIPFAKPPNGTLRWQPPEDPEPWDLFVADELKPVCIQDLLSTLWITHIGWNSFSEDCLNVNIYTPPDINGGPYPVMVWFHGGAYQSSANIQYPGHFLAQRGVVVVVPNYRLGIFGFASTGDSVAPGNFGMLDQVQALEFVRDNIANFGGDPNHVTIFGQSAGASSVGLHLLSPMSRDLFHQGVLHSGSELSFWAVNGDIVNPHDWIHEVAAQHDCDLGDNQAVMDCLRDVGPWVLHRTNFNCSFCLGFAPVVDGPGGFLPADPMEMRTNGDFAPVPIMEGLTREDGFLYALAFGIGNLTNFEGVSREDFEGWLRLAVDMFGYYIEDKTLVEDVYQALHFFYSPWPNLDDEAANLHQLGMMITDVAYGYPTDSEVKVHTEVADTYYYVFGFRGSNHSNILPEWMGVPHMLDLPYVFGYPQLKDNPAVRNDTQMFIDPIDWTKEDAEFAEFTMGLWVNFAKFGNPTPNPMTHPLGGDVTWEQFTGDEHKYLYFANDAVEVRENYKQIDNAFWTHYLNDMVLGEDGPTPPKVQLSRKLAQGINLFMNRLAKIQHEQQ